MRSTAAALVLAVSLGLAFVAVRAAELPVEEAVETSNHLLALPTATGRIAARSCVGCPERYLELTTATKFFIGQQEVAFEEFGKAMALSTRRSVAIHYLPADSRVTRIILSSAD